MSRKISVFIFVGSFALAWLLTSCWGLKANHSSDVQWDVRGNYDIAYDNKLVLRLNIGGAIREKTAQGYGEVVDFGTHEGKSVKLDLNAFCQKPEVKCPNEIFWERVSIDQKKAAVKQNAHVVYVINNTTHDLAPGEKAATVGGFVDHTSHTKFLLGLGAKAGAQSSCAALSLSLADGRFTHKGETVGEKTVYRDGKGRPCQPSSADGGSIFEDAGTTSDGGTSQCNPVQVPTIEKPKNAQVDGIKDGRIVIGWVGGCAFGPFLVGATITLETRFTGTRTGELDPPPYTPVAPIEPNISEPSSSEPTPSEPITSEQTPETPTKDGGSSD